jgi:hypothetical protein
MRLEGGFHAAVLGGHLLMPAELKVNLERIRTDKLGR